MNTEFPSRPMVARHLAPIGAEFTVVRHPHTFFRAVAGVVLAVAVVFGPRLASARPWSVDHAASATLTVMTYNLRYASSSAPNAWNVRRPIMREVIRQIAPDVFGTTNGFKAIRQNGSQIDWILTRGDFIVDRTEIVTFSRDGQFPSDHFPGVTRLRMGAARDTRISP